ncbi:MAG TPA: hypothetical protein PKN48_11425 [Bacteroidales bacterium]|nr:hypothetical protein [Bacteroidales bacterium]
MKRNRLLTCVIMLLFITSLYSCRILYIPNAVHAPMLSEKNEFNGAVLVGSSGVDIEAAFSPGKHWGIMVDGSFYDNSMETDNTSNHKHLFGEIGAGYHTKFGGIGRFDVYGGGGLGTSSTTNHWFGPFGGTSEGNYNRFFVQPSVGIGTDYADVNLATRISYLSFYDIYNSNMTFDHTRTFFWEPALTARAGYKWVKFFVQIGVSVPMDTYFDIQYQPFMFSTGINLNFGKWKPDGI